MNPHALNPTEADAELDEILKDVCTSYELHVATKKRLLAWRDKHQPINFEPIRRAAHELLRVLERTAPPPFRATTDPQPPKTQADVIAFVQDPENIAKAVEGSMNKRLAAASTDPEPAEAVRVSTSPYAETSFQVATNFTPTAPSRGEEGLRELAAKLYWKAADLYPDAGNSMPPAFEYKVRSLFATTLQRVELEARISLMQKHRRWFERLAEYADKKKDVMDEYDDELASLKSQLAQLQPTEPEKRS